VVGNELSDFIAPSTPATFPPLSGDKNEIGMALIRMRKINEKNLEKIENDRLYLDLMKLRKLLKNLFYK
jgi:hypothetical protein